ncbi:MAG: SWF/SNF helicase family protein, partial [Coriobacteriia bacterium]|nr:SWF/SNF helicase family protein [Coriobacteriia bacterium]
LKGDKDQKLLGLAKIVKGLLKDGFNPIVFCYYIPTAQYVAEELRTRLPKKVAVEAVTGKLTPEEREARIEELAENEQHVLVATDCLSEGVNLQSWFDAVVHYDMSWNPTTHEQREGRVDRFGQVRPEVRVVTYFGKDNPIDGIVLNVLIKKHKTIRTALGVSVPVPVGSETVVEAIFEGLLLRDASRGVQQLRLEMEEAIKPKQAALDAEWQNAAEREKRSRTVFAQETIRPDEVAAKLSEVVEQLGSQKDVEEFVVTSLRAAGARVSGDGVLDVDLREARLDLRDLIGRDPDQLMVTFDNTSRYGTYLHRTHPTAEAIANWVLDTALDEVADAPATRASVLRTDAVSVRTTLLLTRYRFSIEVRRGEDERRLLAETSGVLAFRGSPAAADWLSADELPSLLSARPSGNVVGAGESIRRVLDSYEEHIAERVEADARAQAQALESEYRELREAARAKGVTYKVRPHLPPDVLGVYVFVPQTPGQVG